MFFHLDLATKYQDDLLIFDCSFINVCPGGSFEVKWYFLMFFGLKVNKDSLSEQALV